MIAEHMKKLKELNKKTGADLSLLVELYNQKQTQYLSRTLNNDKVNRALNNNRDINNLFYDSDFGKRALKVFDSYISRKGDSCFANYVNQYLPYNMGE